MRSIKFRLWEKELKAIITSENSDQFLISLDGRVFDTGFTFSNQASYCENMIAMQFTGLKDVNSVDIYEGDIVKSHFYGGYMPDDIAHIEYDDSSAQFIYNSAEQDAFVYGAEQGQLEVIGNIYENPELLKAAN